MAKIVDPDQLNQNTEVVFDKDLKTIQLLVAGNLNDDSPGRTSGVTGQAVYSFCKEEWLTDATLNELRFPFDPIFEQKLVLINGWKWKDVQTRDLLRDVGWQEVDGSKFAGLQSLGPDFSGDQAYYQQVSGFDSTAYASVSDFDKDGAINEAVEIVGDGGTPDYSSFLKVFLRPQGKIYSSGELVADQALSAVDFRFYGVPLSTSNDITDGSGAPASDATIDNNSPYTGMTVDYLKGSGFTTAAAQSYSVGDVVQDGSGRWAFCTSAGTMDASGAADYTNNGGTATWEAFAGEVQIGTNYYAFNRIIDGNGGTTKQIYEWMQRQLRKTENINDDTLGSPNQNGSGDQYGAIANELGYFVGDVLHSSDGAAITNFDSNATNNIRQHDITVDGGGLDSEGIPATSTSRSYPFIAAGTLVFSQNLVAEPDVDTLYKMYFDYSVRLTGTDVAVTSASGDTCTLTSTTTDLSTWSNGDFMHVSGFSNSENDGMYVVTGATTSTSAPVRKVDGATLVDEAAGNTVSLDTNPFDSPDAIVVQDTTPTDISGQITSDTIGFSFDYTNNNQGGRTANSDAPVTVIALGQGGARWVAASFTIAQATGQTFPVNAADELVYSNQ